MYECVYMYKFKMLRHMQYDISLERGPWSSEYILYHHLEFYELILMYYE